MADVAIRASATAAVPRDYTIPGAQEILPKSVRAVMDGTSAGSAWFPCLQLIDPGGNVMFSAVGNTTVAAGASADVSWFPDVVQQAAAVTPITAGFWTRVAEPLISPTAGWENGSTLEPDVHYESGTYKMWYTGGAGTQAIGYATCTSDPTIPANWTKYAGNPVLGQGGSGIAGAAGGSHVRKIAGTYNIWYRDDSGAFGGGTLFRSTSADGITWNAPTTAVASGAIAGTGGWGNSDLWFDGTSWWLFLEASISVGPTNQWAIYLMKNTSYSNDGGWVAQNGGNPLTTLQVAGYNNGYGQGLSIAEIDGTDTFQIGAPYVLWCHASKATSPIASDIYHAYGTAPSFTTWTPASPFDLVHNGSAFEFSQAADPNVLQVAGKSYLFFSGDNAANNQGYVNLATFNGTLAQFLNGSQGSGTITNTTSTGGSITVTNPTGPTVDVEVAPSGVTAGSYGDSSDVARFTVGADGRLTAASSSAITVAPLTNPAVPDLIFTAAGDVIMAPS